MSGEFVRSDREYYDLNALDGADVGPYRNALMETCMRKLKICLAALALSSVMNTANAAIVDAVEYYNVTAKHWFRTSDAGEINAFDANPAWARTGQNYRIWQTAADAPVGALPACQYAAPVYGADIRYYGVDPFECDFLSHYAEAIFQGTPFYALMPQNGACAEGTQPAYRNFANANADVRFRYSVKLSAYQDTSDVPGFQAHGVVFCVPGVSDAKKSDAIRFLTQATFGPTDALVDQVLQIGIPAFLEQQLNAPTSSYPALPYVPFQAPDTCKPDGSKPATDPVNICARDNYTLFLVQLRFLQNALTGQDQLRQRVAFALSQIHVVSGVEINHAYGMARYQQMLLDNAFGNFRDLLYSVTLSPVMGRYLDMANNDKPDPVRGVTPNENYAREVMQLFSIGLVQLNADGTQKRDAQGRTIPTYDEDTIEGFAYTFTGWTYPPLPGAISRFRNPVNYSSDMVPFQNNHDMGPKKLLNGVVLPAGQTAQKDLNDAIDTIFNHPNVAPFISRQLIQKLVGGSPSPAFVARIAKVFNGDYFTPRGDLKAVVRAILLDPEARGEIKTASAYGHLKEPVLLTTGLIRGLNGRSDGVYLRSQLGALGQPLFISPSVFNFYPPDYTLVSSGSIAPEFAILNAATVFGRANFINNLVFSNGIAADPSVTGSIGTSLDLSAYQSLAADPASLVDKLSFTFSGGSLSTSVRRSIVTAVNAVAATDTIGRARTAAYLVLTSSQAQVER